MTYINQKSSDTMIIIYVLLYIFVLVVISITAHTFGAQINDILTYGGLWTSIYGLFLTFLQLMKLQKTTDATADAVKATREKMDLMLSISDISKHVVNLRFVKECVTNSKMELARLRLGDVKDFINKIGYIEGLKYDAQTYKWLINSLESNINSLEQEINKTQKVDKDILAKDLERVASFLMQIEYELKSKKI